MYIIPRTKCSSKNTPWLYNELSVQDLNLHTTIYLNNRNLHMVWSYNYNPTYTAELNMIICRKHQYKLCFNGQPLPAIRMSSANVTISATHHMTMSRIHVHVIVSKGHDKHPPEVTEDGTEMSGEELIFSIMLLFLVTTYRLDENAL